MFFPVVKIVIKYIYLDNILKYENVDRLPMQQMI